MRSAGQNLSVPRTSTPPQGGGYSAKAFVTKGKRHYLPRLMPKAIARSKTRKSVSKRFKITGTGKVMRQHASRRHLLSSKSAKRKRHMAKSAEVDKTDTYRIKSNMPFG
jgi:large subunit ribosomal protein L35